MSAAPVIRLDSTYTPLTFKQRVSITAAASAMVAAYLAELRQHAESFPEAARALFAERIASCERAHEELRILEEDNFQAELRERLRKERP